MPRIPVISLRLQYNSNKLGEITPVKPIYKAIYRGLQLHLQLVTPQTDHFRCQNSKLLERLQWLYSACKRGAKRNGRKNPLCVSFWNATCIFLIFLSHGNVTIRKQFMYNISRDIYLHNQTFMQVNKSCMDRKGSGYISYFKDIPPVKQMAHLPCIGLSWPITKPPFASCAIYFHDNLFHFVIFGIIKKIVYFKKHVAPTVWSKAFSIWGNPTQPQNRFHFWGEFCFRPQTEEWTRTSWNGDVKWIYTLNTVYLSLPNTL